MLLDLFVCYSCVFFFFKQKTAYEMRISDWSSDVCSSDLGGLGRFRVNVFHQRGALGMVMRYVRAQVPRLDELYGMPPGLKNMILQKRGLILMVGATGSGKSTTLAAMINHRNEHQSGHILTIEDPIEFIHPNQRRIDRKNKRESV